MNATGIEPQAAPQGRNPDRWQRMFDAAEALARRREVTTIVRSAAFDAELLHACMRQGTPAVFESLPRDWTGMHGDAGTLERTLGEVPCSDTAPHRGTLGQFLQDLRSGACRGTGGFPVSAELRGLCGLPSRTGAVEWGQVHLFGGAASAVTPLHRDAGDGLNVHLLGGKHWALLSPLHARALLKHPGTAAGGFQEADVALHEFVLRNAHPMPPPLVQVVRPGQAIFVPSGWFHEVRLLEPALSLAAPLHLVG